MERLALSQSTVVIGEIKNPWGNCFKCREEHTKEFQFL